MRYAYIALRWLFGLLDFLRLDDLLDLFARGDDKNEQDHNRDEKPTTQDQEQQQPLSTSITRNIGRRLSQRIAYVVLPRPLST